MDIEESGRSEYSNDPDRDEFHSENREQYEASIDRQQANLRREKRDDIARHARDSLQKYDARLRVAKDTKDIVRLLDEMRHTYAGSFKPRDVNVYVRCRYYLSRITALSRKK